ncbi:MAG: hypothetical protein ACREFQ_20900 [Stellaceae bacterium]
MRFDRRNGSDRGVKLRTINGANAASFFLSDEVFDPILFYGVLER